MHHRTRWSAGGTTDIDQAVLLCPSCHLRAAHGRHPWEVRDLPAGGGVYLEPPERAGPRLVPDERDGTLPEPDLPEGITPATPGPRDGVERMTRYAADVFVGHLLGNAKAARAT